MIFHCFASLQWSHGFPPRNCNLVLCLFSLSLARSLNPLPLSSPSHLPHSPVRVPGRWHYTDGPGTCKDVSLVTGKDAYCEVFFSCLGKTRVSVFLFFYLYQCPTEFLFKKKNFLTFKKPPSSAKCGSVYRYISQCLMQRAHSHTQSFTLTSCRLPQYLAGSWLFCR